MAVEWYCLAAEQGHREAQMGLALIYLAGRGVQRDEAEALRWRRALALEGAVAA